LSRHPCRLKGAEKHGSFSATGIMELRERLCNWL